MKKVLTILLAACMLVCVGITATACFGGESKDHVCSYTKEVAEDKYLKEAATCTTKAVYYKSCSCGNKGTATFEYGNFGHTVGDWIEEIPATCTENGTKGHYHCSACNKDLDKDYNSISLDISAGHNYVNGSCTVCGKSKVSEGLVYKLSTDKTCYSVTGIGYCSDAEIIIPSTYNDLPVTSIAREAFENKKSITAVTIGDNVESIDYGAFSGCTGLKSVTMGKNVKVVGGSAFYDCPITDGVYISDIAAWCNIGFTNESSYKKGSSNPVSRSRKLYLNNELVTDLVIPDEVTIIKEIAFYQCESITSVTIGKNVTEIESRAFYSCEQIKSVKIQADAIKIRSEAFRYCKALDDVKVYGNISLFTFDAFDDCNKFKYNEYENAEYLGNETNPYLLLLSIKSNDITTFSINENCKYIYGPVFDGCYLIESINIPKNVEGVGKGIFGGCAAIKNITVDENNAKYKAIDGNLYSKDGKTLVTYARGNTAETFTVPDGVENIGSEAFKYSDKLKSIIISDGVKNIESNAFYGCLALTSITIGDGVTSVKEEAIYNCALLDTVKIGSNGIAALQEKTFKECNAIANIYYTGDINAWVKTEGLGNLMNCNDASKKLYINSEEVTSVTITDATKINDYAFYNCSEISSVTLPDGLTSIGDFAFAGCSALTSINIPNGITSLGVSSFYDCSLLSSMNLSNCTQLTNIADSAFSGCSAMTNLSIPESIKSIGGTAFSGCRALRYIDFRGDINKWVEIEGLQHLMMYGHIDSISKEPSKELKMNGVKVQYVTINTASKINDYAFYGCQDITSVTIGESVTSISFRAFDGCKNLSAASFENSVGWFVSDHSDATSGTNLDLGNKSKNATYLKSDYTKKYWKRSSN